MFREADFFFSDQVSVHLLLSSTQERTENLLLLAYTVLLTSYLDGWCDYQLSAVIYIRCKVTVK